MYWSCRGRTSNHSNWQYPSYFNTYFDSNGLLFLFSYISEKHLQFRKNTQKHYHQKSKALLRSIFGLSYKSNWIYLLWNGFSNYVYLRDMYITLKRIVKILVVSVLRILLICKVLNFKVLNFPKFAYNCPCEKVNFSLIYPPNITNHNF